MGYGLRSISKRRRRVRRKTRGNSEGTFSMDRASASSSGTGAEREESSSSRRPRSRALRRRFVAVSTDPTVACCRCLVACRFRRKSEHDTRIAPCSVPRVHRG
uniref:Uncharacterized protein n=1 Tax=Oryza meridionalis TaxID=40149 RepID=A0A0E0CRF3_9ORYZ